MFQWISRLAALALGFANAFALLGVGSAAAAKREPTPHVGISAPTQVSPGGTALFSGSLGVHAPIAVRLQLRRGSSWETVARAHANSGAYLLSWRVPRRPAVLTLRVLALVAPKRLGASAEKRLRVRAGAPTTAGAGASASVVPASQISSVPAPNSPGSVVIAGQEAVAKGSVLAVSVGPHTPDGFLGMVKSVTRRGDQTIVQTVPTNIEAALPEGSFELADATRVESAQSASRRLRTAPSAQAAGNQDEGALNQDLSKSIKCAGGATFAAKGTVGLSATPKLSVSWSVFHGITASYTETVTASASLSGEVSAAGDCSFTKTGLLAHSADLGTFVGDVFGVPIVVSLQGQVYFEGNAQAQGSVIAGVSGQASASGGIAYAHGKASVISPSTSLRFGATGPTLNASASLGAHVTPELQVLLYGVGGPVFDATTGLDFNADIHGNPWWDLTSPLTVTASLQAPPLGLSTPDLMLYHHVFDIAHAQGPYSTPVVTTPTPPLTPAVPRPSVGPTLIYDGDSTIPLENEEDPLTEGDRSFYDWSGATGQPAEVSETLPSVLSGYRCVALLANETLNESQSSALGGYLQQGGTILEIGEHTGYDVADATLSRFAESVGAGMSLNDDSHDEGENVTSETFPSSLTEGVYSLGDNWVSTLSLSGAAQPLIDTADEEGTLVATQSIGSGTLIMAGDSNMFSDNNNGFYDEDDNGRFVDDMCP